MNFQEAKAKNKRLRGHGPLIVKLTSVDPHDMPNNEAIADWWGKKIIVSQPVKPKEEHACNPMYIYRVIGPPEFVNLLASLGRHGRFACEHCIEFLDE